MSTPTHQAWWSSEAEFERFSRVRRDSWDRLGSLEQQFTQAIKATAFDLAYTQERFHDVEAWRQEALTELRRCMALPVERRIMSARVVSRSQADGFIREEIEFESVPGRIVIATVLIPSDRQGPYPAVVALHDMGGFRAFGREKLIPFDGEPEYLTEFRRTCYEGQGICVELVRRGFLMICIDSMMFGERTPLAEEDRAKFREDRLRWTKEESQKFSFDISLIFESTAFRTAILTGQTWAGMVAHDDLATVDYLVSRSDVDASRMGCVGLSYGAYRTNYLAALDDRIAAAVTVCWMGTLDSVIGFNVGGAMGGFTLIPGIHTRLDICDIASLACPRPLLVISGWQDLLMQPHGIASAHRKLRTIWTKAGAPEHLGSLCLDAPHEFNREMQSQAFAWFERWLKPAG